ncbi:MAG: hypothetical protein QOI04_2267 [Verrucomicrobiota bacterium]|jgi:outer membrane protein TolC
MKNLALIFLALATLARPVLAITLEDALATTLEKNPAIQQAHSALEQAAGRRLILRAIALPRARIGSAAGAEGGDRAGQGSGIKPFGFAQGFLTQALFNAAIPASYRRGNVEVLIAQQRLNVAVVEQLHTARVAFYTALYNHSLETLREEQRNRLEQNVSSEKERYESGKSDRGAFTAATLVARELEPAVEEAHRAHQGAVLKLAETMGHALGPDAKLPEPDGALEFTALHVDLGSETAAALERRTDLKLARLLVRAAEEDQRILEADYYPAINGLLSGEYIPSSGARRENETSPQRSNGIISSEYRAQADYTWRVVDNGKVGGAVAKQRAIRQMNDATREKLEANVPRELERIRNELQSVAASEKSLEAAVAASEENVSIIRESLAQGLLSQLDFRTAENGLLETKSGVLTATYQQDILRAEWDRATGRYFQFSDDTAGNVR